MCRWKARINRSTIGINGGDSAPRCPDAAARHPYQTIHKADGKPSAFLLKHTWPSGAVSPRTSLEPIKNRAYTEHIPSIYRADVEHARTTQALRRHFFEGNRLFLGRRRNGVRRFSRARAFGGRRAGRGHHGIGRAVPQFRDGDWPWSCSNIGRFGRIANGCRGLTAKDAKLHCRKEAQLAQKGYTT